MKKIKTFFTQKFNIKTAKQKLKILENIFLNQFFVYVYWEDTSIIQEYTNVRK